MILNPDKCSYLVLGNKKQVIQSLHFENFILPNVSEEKILGITFDNKLRFDSHIKVICKKANQKLSALSRISCYMHQKQRKLIINSFIKSQFNYCPLIWLFCSRKANNKIDNIQERSLRLLCNDYESSFIELLSLNKEITTHATMSAIALHRSIQSYYLKGINFREHLISRVEKSYISRALNFANGPFFTAF